MPLCSEFWQDCRKALDKCWELGSVQVIIPQPKGMLPSPHSAHSFKQKSFQRAVASAGWNFPGYSKCSLQEKALGMLDSLGKWFPVPVNHCNESQAHWVPWILAAHGPGITTTPLWGHSRLSVPLGAEQHSLLQDADSFVQRLRMLEKVW